MEAAVEVKNLSSQSNIMLFLVKEIPNQLCNIVWATFLFHCTEILNLEEQSVTPENWLHKSQFYFCVFIYSVSTSLSSWETLGWVELHMCHCTGAVGREGRGS